MRNDINLCTFLFLFLRTCKFYYSLCKNTHFNTCINNAKIKLVTKIVAFAIFFNYLGWLYILCHIIARDENQNCSVD